MEEPNEDPIHHASAELMEYMRLARDHSEAARTAYMLILARECYPQVRECQIAADEILEILTELEALLGYARRRLVARFRSRGDARAFALSDDLKTILVDFVCGHRRSVRIRTTSAADESRIRTAMALRRCFCCELEEAQSAVPRAFRDSWHGAWDREAF